MLDFVSTREGTDAETRGCARLVAAVIASAVRDACEPPTSEELRTHSNRKTSARQALRFLFGRHSVFSLYAELIGTNADTMRAALRSDSELHANGVNNLTAAARRHLQWRLLADEMQPPCRRAVNAPPTDVDREDADTEEAAAAH